jgi:hypothetical protein
VHDALTNIAIKKQIFWELVGKDCDNEERELLGELAMTVTKEANWQDVVAAMGVLRAGEKGAAMARDVAVEGFRVMLKINRELAEEIVGSLK